MFNPSTADETKDDPTIRKCIRFAMKWGYGSLVILNLFAIRGTDPRKVSRVHDPVGPLNDYWILKSVESAREVICAWGCGQHMKREDLNQRPAQILAKIEERSPQVNIRCLGYRNDGHPRHPLMLEYATPRIEFEVRANG